MKKFITNKYQIALDVIISLVIVAALLHFAGFNEFTDALASIDLFWLLVSIILLLGMYLMMTYRMKILLEEMKSPLPWLSIFKCHLTGMLLSDVTPARSGYLSTALVMHKNYKVPSEKAMVSILGPQAYDFIFKIVVGGLALLFLLEYAGIENGWIMYAGVVGLSFVLLVMLLLMYSRRFLNFFSFSENWPFIGRIYAMFHRVQDHSDVVVKKTPILLLLLLVTWIFKALSWYAVALSLGITIGNFAYPQEVFYFFFQPLATMLEFVPTPTLAGLGFSEAGGVIIMSLFGITAAQATAFMLVARFKTTIVNLPGIEEALKLIK
ncbi:flippase-like domain-containing protein [Candidatus Micrarchaeota archaeon]|nr:flippase-like domain-containing protein [Candidatus Micrarchaeota archaeon]MBD3418018.1 flippase-like domain-containing protein [Candidatus Micrarchaeota archaeon]